MNPPRGLLGFPLAKFGQNLEVCSPHTARMLKQQHGYQYIFIVYLSWRKKNVPLGDLLSFLNLHPTVGNSSISPAKSRWVTFDAHRIAMPWYIHPWWLGRSFIFKFETSTISPQSKRKGNLSRRTKAKTVCRVCTKIEGAATFLTTKLSSDKGCKIIIKLTHKK